MSESYFDAPYNIAIADYLDSNIFIPIPDNKDYNFFIPTPAFVDYTLFIPIPRFEDTIINVYVNNTDFGDYSFSIIQIDEDDASANIFIPIDSSFPYITHLNIFDFPHAYSDYYCDITISGVSHADNDILIAAEFLEHEDYDLYISAPHDDEYYANYIICGLFEGAEDYGFYCRIYEEDSSDSKIIVSVGGAPIIGTFHVPSITIEYSDYSFIIPSGIVEDYDIRICIAEYEDYVYDISVSDYHDSTSYIGITALDYIDSDFIINALIDAEVSTNYLLSVYSSPEISSLHLLTQYPGNEDHSFLIASEKPYDDYDFYVVISNEEHVDYEFICNISDLEWDDYNFIYAHDLPYKDYGFIIPEYEFNDSRVEIYFQEADYDDHTFNAGIGPYMYAETNYYIGISFTYSQEDYNIYIPISIYNYIDNDIYILITTSHDWLDTIFITKIIDDGYIDAYYRFSHSDPYLDAYFRLQCDWITSYDEGQFYLPIADPYKDWWFQLYLDWYYENWNYEISISIPYSDWFYYVDILGVNEEYWKILIANPEDAKDWAFLIYTGQVGEPIYPEDDFGGGFGVDGGSAGKGGGGGSGEDGGKQSDGMPPDGSAVSRGVGSPASVSRNAAILWITKRIVRHVFQMLLNNYLTMVNLQKSDQYVGYNEPTYVMMERMKDLDDEWYAFKRYFERTYDSDPKYRMSASYSQETGWDFLRHDQFGGEGHHYMGTGFKLPRGGEMPDEYHPWIVGERMNLNDYGHYDGYGNEISTTYDRRTTKSIIDRVRRELMSLSSEVDDEDIALAAEYAWMEMDEFLEWCTQVNIKNPFVRNITIVRTDDGRFEAIEQEDTW